MLVLGFTTDSNTSHWKLIFVSLFWDGSESSRFCLHHRCFHHIWFHPLCFWHLSNPSVRTSIQTMLESVQFCHWLDKDILMVVGWSESSDQKPCGDRNFISGTHRTSQPTHCQSMTVDTWIPKNAKITTKHINNSLKAHLLAPVHFPTAHYEPHWTLWWLVS